MTSNPMTVDDFVGRFFVADWKLLPLDRSQISGTDGTGTVLSSRRAPNGWTLSAVTQDLDHWQTAIVRSRFSLLSQERTFLAYDRTLPVPPLDEDGSGWAGADTPVLSGITNRFTVSFSGFPPEYEIGEGTVFGLLWDTDRRYLGQFMDAVTTTNLGGLSNAQITPALPDSIMTGAPVELIRPLAKFKMTGGLNLSWSSGSHARWSFKAESTYDRS